MPIFIFILLLRFLQGPERVASGDERSEQPPVREPLSNG
jgi:hypothetical protein